MHIGTTIIENEERTIEERGRLLDLPAEKMRPTEDTPPMFTDVESRHVPGLRARVVGWGRYDSYGGVRFVTLLLAGAHFIHCTEAELTRSWTEIPPG